MCLKRAEVKMIIGNILEAIGNTPTLDAKRFMEDVNPNCSGNLFVKLENLNPGGSHKIRTALAMILNAQKEGRLNSSKEQVIIEGTGGNLGIAISMIACVLKYKAILVVPDSFSESKKRTIRSYGQTVIESKSINGNDSHFVLARQLAKENQNYVLLSQTTNPANPMVHAQYTAGEIINDFANNKPDFIVGSIGSGGHMMGICRRLKKEKWPTKVIITQPQECSFLEKRFSSHKIQGTAVGYFGDIMNFDFVDGFMDISTEEAISAMRLFLSSEGVGVGISSGANLAAAIKILKQNNSNAKILTLAYDNSADYLDLL